jgi:hypothetical protein
MASRRQLGGVFVWSLETFLLALLTFALQQSLAALNLLNAGGMHTWAVLMVLLSSGIQLLVQLVLAAWHKQDALLAGDVSETAHLALVSGKGSETAASDDVIRKTIEKIDNHATHSALHKAVAQAHLCVVFFVTAAYLCVLFESVQRAQWAAVFFATSPSIGVDALVIIIAALMCAFLTLSLILAVCNAFAATPVGESNYLILFAPLVLSLCMFYPLLHEIGQRELFFCTTAETNLMAMLFANFAIATSFLFFVLDLVEFDACHVLPAILHSRLQGDAGVRLYLMLHALFVAFGLTVYVVLVPTVPLFVAILFIAAAVIASGSSLVALPAALQEQAAKVKFRDASKPDNEAQDDIPVGVVMPAGQSMMRLRSVSARRALVAGTGKTL